MSSIALTRTRESEYQNVDAFITKNGAGTAVLLHKNGFGKSTIQVRVFKEFDNSCIIAQTHEHIENVILPKLKEVGLKRDIDYVYYRRMEDICTTFAKIKGVVDELRQGAYTELERMELDNSYENKILTKNYDMAMLYVGMSVRHRNVIKCIDPDCPFRLQEWAISKDNPDRTRKVVSTVRMFVKKELQFKTNVIILDELDGTLDPQEEKCSRELYEQFRKDVGNSIYLTFDELDRMAILNMFGRQIKNRQEIIESVEKRRKYLQDEIWKNNFSVYDDKEVREMNLRWKVANDGFLMTDRSGRHEDWWFKDRIHRVPMLCEIADALTDEHRYLRKKIIASMARMRKNPILQRKLKILFWMLYQRTMEPGVESTAYKEYKVQDLFPKFLGEDCNLPDDRWNIFVQKPSIRTSNEYFSNTFKEGNPEAFGTFLEIDKQLSHITTKFNRQYGLLITFKALEDWLHAIRSYSPEKRQNA